MTIALVLIDIQRDYFPGGRMALPGATEACRRAARLLDGCRALSLPVFHVRHLSTRPGATFFLPNTEGIEIHPDLHPLDGEPVVDKHFPNSFRDTPLDRLLRERGVGDLVLAGMMSQMCVDATTRAAFDLGYGCRVAHDACAAAPISFAGVGVPAEQVHAAIMGALAAVYARVDASEAILASLAATASLPS